MSNYGTGLLFMSWDGFLPDWDEDDKDVLEYILDRRTPLLKIG